MWTWELNYLSSPTDKGFQPEGARHLQDLISEHTYHTSRMPRDLGVFMMLNMILRFHVHRYQKLYIKLNTFNTKESLIMIALINSCRAEAQYFSKL
jgi:hypothetical protein